MINKLLNYALLVLATIVLSFTLTMTFASDSFFSHAEKYLSSDHQIRNTYAVERTIFIFLCAAGIVLFLLKGAWVYTLKRVGVSGLPVHIKLFYILLSAILSCTFLFKNVYFYYKEDGILEDITVFLAFAGSLILLHVAWSYKFTKRGLFVLFLAFLILIFVMEEISWGQRVFGWKTSQLMQQANVQHENNLHNLFNEYFDVGYLLVCTLMGSLFFFRDQWIYILNKFKPTRVLAEFIPAKSFFYAGYFYLFLMIFTLFFDRGGETLEAAFALTLLFYAIDIA